MSYNNIVLNIIPALYEGYIVSVHRMVMENRPVDPGSIQCERFFFEKLSIGTHIVGLVHKNHIINEV